MGRGRAKSLESLQSLAIPYMNLVRAKKLVFYLLKQTQMGELLAPGSLNLFSTQVPQLEFKE